MRLAVTAAALVPLAIWFVLALGRGRFWRTSIRLPPASVEPVEWPDVVAVVPARDEAAVLPTTLPTLLAQDYPGRFRVLVVDDDSTDDTAVLAGSLGAEVVAGTGPPPGWAGKVAAMDAGVRAAASPDFLLFTDADIAFPPDALRSLVRAAVANDLVLTSQMVRLRSSSFWERWLVPAFVWFFAQLYPFALVNRGRTAAAAGGCMLVRCSALEGAGGLATIRDAVIDDVALGTVLARQGRIWLGLSDDIVSVRPYPGLRELWAMVSRSAYTQLRYSPLLLAGTVLGLAVVYLGPPVSVALGIAVGSAAATALGVFAWAVMTLTFVPMLRFYRLSALRAIALPLIAVLYAAMTLDSARQHRAGRGAAWKGRVRTG